MKDGKNGIPSRAIRGMITKGVGGLYSVAPAPGEPLTGEILCSARGKFRLDGITPLPGDDVTAEPDTEAGAADGDRFVITGIKDRKNVLIRPPLSNLTYMFAVIPSCRPRPDLLTADKLIAILESAGIEPVVVVTKADLDRASAEELREVYEKAGYRTVTLSAVTGEGCGDLIRFLGGMAAEAEKENGSVRAAFAGVSGAGKSTLLSKLFPSLSLKTGTVSRKTERGRHTTRCTELYSVPVGDRTIYLADTPGFSMLDFTRFNFLPAEDLPSCFREFGDCLGKCRYTGCTHVREEGCSVIEKIERGEIAKSRHDSYVAIRDEIRKKPDWKREKEEKERAKRIK
ncbi:MAG: ribosome small subunit-dependent GTPase A [Clostridia bacterium]|nr:ribosome small subunit-dependent GTPase A [Clostridia bacterium]